jgi:hypothetical protein
MKIEFFLLKMKIEVIYGTSLQLLYRYLSSFLSEKKNMATRGNFVFDWPDGHNCWAWKNVLIPFSTNFYRICLANALHKIHNLQL